MTSCPDITLSEEDGVSDSSEEGEADIERAAFESGFDNPTNLQADEELFETGLSVLLRDSPLTYSIEGTHHCGRAARIEKVKVGDELVLRSDWESPFFNPVAIEVFNAQGETLGYLTEEFSASFSGHRELACLLPYAGAKVSSVTPLSQRRKNAKYALMDIEITFPDELHDNPWQIPGVIAEAKRLLVSSKSDRVRETRTIATKAREATQSDILNAKGKESGESVEDGEKGEERRKEKKGEDPGRKLIGAIVDMLETDTSGSSLNAEQIKNAVKGVKTTGQANSLLETAWKGGLIRRVLQDNEWIYGRHLSPEEWAAKREDLAKEFEETLKKAFKAEGDERRMALEEELRQLKEAELNSRNAATEALEEAEREKAKAVQCEDTLKQIDSELAVERERAVSIQAKMESVGAFALGKKAVLKKELKASQDRVNELIASRNDIVAAKESALRRFDECAASAEENEGNASQAERKAARRERELAKLKKELESRDRPEQAGEDALLGYMVKLAMAWESPAGLRWFVENVADFASEQRVRELLSNGQVFERLVGPEGDLYVPTDTIILKDLGIVEKGQEVELGKFPIEGREEPTLIWHVVDLDQKEGCALLLCDYALQDMPFHSKKEGTWEDSSLARWLSDEFVPRAFTLREREALVNRDGLGTAFVLSRDEFKGYKKKPGILPVKEPYKDNDPWGKNQWWLRTPTDSSHTRMMYVTVNNGVSEKGISLYVRNGWGVRPAIWVRIAGKGEGSQKAHSRGKRS